MARPRIFVLTGAGVSAESGLGTFRDTDGVWTRHTLEDVATPGGFGRNPERVHDFYNARRRALREAAPNPAHRALARLEQAVREAGGEFLLVTQNVDDLHERAGSLRLLHMHGELMRARCNACGDRRAWTEDMFTDTPCEACGCAGALRPDGVWCGEMPYGMDAMRTALATCDLFAAIGTSGEVYPAAGLVSEAGFAGAHTVELNLEPSLNAGAFREGRYGPASRMVAAWADEIIAGLGPGPGPRAGPGRSD